MTAVELLILSLACWRVAFLVTNDDAPFKIMRWLRLRYGGGLYCIRCMSVWAAILTFLLWFTPLQPVVYIAAISGGALMLHKYVGYDYVQSQPDS